MSEFKYRVGDKVLIKSIDWYNENKDMDGFVHCGDRVFDDYMSVFCGSVVTIGRVYPYNGYDIREDMQCRTWTDEMIEGLVEEETTNVMDEDKMLIGWIKEPNRYRLVPDKDYEIKYDEKGFFYLEKKKKEYPTTIEECCKILGLEFNPFYTGVKRQVNYKDGLLHNLKCLLIYRDAYWKLAGDEMGLGKPWEPDWKNEEGWIHCITNDCGEICCTGFRGGNKILAFPTVEMRDAFYENFKELIESCKEFL